MEIGKRICNLRTRQGLTQEKLAELLGVSRQAVQKWETGASRPEVDNLITLAKKLGVSLDALLLGTDARLMEEIAAAQPIQPDYETWHKWEQYSVQLDVEYTQSVEEGKDVAAYQGLFDAVAHMPASAWRERMADVLFDMVCQAGVVEGYPYVEPSDLDNILALSESANHPYLKQVQADRDRVTGAWLGRACGCLLGKTVEGIRTNELHPLLKETGNFPMHRYILHSDLNEELLSRYSFPLAYRCYADTVECMPADDDTNYTVMAALMVEQYGRDFTPAHVAQTWMASQPKNAYCTAERVAYRNFINGYLPPQSATYKNPFREWIGAQIRGDYFGYINPGRPAVAADMAWRDASISHIKNGIYGEMLIAAMLAWAAVCDDIEEVIRVGMAHIPTQSRLHEALTDILDGWKKGRSEEDTFAHIHQLYDEHTLHGWCHTISNAMIVAACLLYGKGDFGRSICMAVQTGFDTDCNGATVGSILGMMQGEGAIGEAWSAPIHGQIDTAICRYHRVSISDMVTKTLAAAQ